MGKNCCEKANASTKVEFECTIKSALENETHSSISLQRSLQETRDRLLTLGASLSIQLDESTNLELNGELSLLLTEIEELKVKIAKSVSSSVLFEESTTFKFSTTKTDHCGLKDFKHWYKCIEATKSKRSEWLVEASDFLEEANCLICKAEKATST